MEDQELEPLEKAIQTAHSNFFVEEESFIMGCGWLDVFGGNYRHQMHQMVFHCIRESPPSNAQRISSVGIIV